MAVLVLLLFLAFGNSQFTQDTTESTSRLPWNRYDDRDPNAGYGFRNSLGQTDNVIIKDA